MSALLYESGGIVLTNQPQAKGAREGGGNNPWKRLLVLSTIGVAVVLVVFMVVQGALIPPIAVFIVLALVGILLLRARERAGAIMLAIVCALFLALNLPFMIPSLSVPASSVDFLSTTLTVVGLVAALASSIALLRYADPRTARRLAALIGTLCLLAVAVSIVARLTYEGADASPGDIRMVLQDIEFKPQRISGGEGEISVFLENKDTVLHTFTIEELDVDVDVPGNGSTRVTFEVEAGMFEFICLPHEPDMSGSLRVDS
jgi:plastocyanin